MALIAFLIAVTSLLMVIGVRKRREKWLYPALFSRVLLVIFITVKLE
jgi:predicted membrane protein